MITVCIHGITLAKQACWCTMRSGHYGLLNGQVVEYGRLVGTETRLRIDGTTYEKPVFDETVLKEPEEQRGGIEDGEKDEAYIEAVRTVINEGKCSITLIQRRLSLGYARAARIVDVMESEGIVGPGEGSKPREVLVGPEVLETLEAP